MQRAMKVKEVRLFTVSLVYSPRQRTKGTAKNQRLTDYEFNKRGNSFREWGRSLFQWNFLLCILIPLTGLLTFYERLNLFNLVCYPLGRPDQDQRSKRSLGPRCIKGIDKSTPECILQLFWFWSWSSLKNRQLQIQLCQLRETFP